MSYLGLLMFVYLTLNWGIKDVFVRTQSNK